MKTVKRNAAEKDQLTILNPFNNFVILSQPFKDK